MDDDGTRRRSPTTAPVDRMAALLRASRKYVGPREGLDSSLSRRLGFIRAAFVPTPDRPATRSLRPRPLPFWAALGPTLRAPPAAVVAWREGRAADDQIGEAFVWLLAAAGCALESPDEEEAVRAAERVLAFVSRQRREAIERWIDAGSPEIEPAPAEPPERPTSPCAEAVLSCAQLHPTFARRQTDRGLEPRSRAASRSVVCHGPLDAPFARRLWQELKRRTGNRAALLLECADPTLRERDELSGFIRERDRVIVFSSIASLDCPTVQRVIVETLAREERDDASYLVPVRLDDYARDGWRPPTDALARAVRDRVAVSFEGALDEPRRFAAVLDELVEYLPRDGAIEDLA